MTLQQLDDTREKLAEECRAKRELLGISQQALADQTGLGIRTIQRFETGKFWMNMKQYMLIRSVLKLPEIVQETIDTVRVRNARARLKDG